MTSQNKFQVEVWNNLILYIFFLFKILFLFHVLCDSCEIVQYSELKKRAYNKINYKYIYRELIIKF